MVKAQKPEQPKPACQTGVDLTPNARRVLEKRYLRKDSHGRVIETPEGLFRRVAAALAAAELIYDPKADVAAKEDEFYKVMSRLEFLPNSPTLLNAGKKNGQLAACFALPVEDSVELSRFASLSPALASPSPGCGRPATRWAARPASPAAR